MCAEACDRLAAFEGVPRLMPSACWDRCQPAVTPSRISLWIALIMTKLFMCLHVIVTLIYRILSLSEIIPDNVKVVEYIYALMYLFSGLNE